MLGRRSERETLDQLLDGARTGRSGVLVLRGDPGIGKTALLEYAVQSGSDLRVVRAVGVESEMELAFAALHQVCAPLLDRLDRVPRPQRDALETTFGLRPGAAPDRFLVGLAVLTLLSEVSEECPLLCVVDDAHWLDRASAQVFAFVARRLLAESVVMLFGSREPGDELRGLPDLVVDGLQDADARGLLASVIPWLLDVRVREQILAETRGNPLALLELPRGLSPEQLAGGFGLPGALPLSGRLEENFLRRFRALPESTQRLVLISAAEPAGDPALLWRAAAGLGVEREALQLAERAGLMDVGGAPRFRHPLVRSAVYRAASPEERRAAHRALAEATDAKLDPDRRAWHLGEATSGRDEDVAGELERAAGRAKARGGLAAAAAFLERSTTLTIEPAHRAQRALAAAQTAYESGSFDGALALLATAEAGPGDEFQSARVELLRAQIVFASRRGSDAPPMLLEAARRLERLDARLARETYLEAFSAAQFAGRLARGVGVREVAEAARAAPAPAQPADPADLLLAGLALRFTEGYAAGAPKLKCALDAFRSDELAGEQWLRWIWVVSRSAVDLWDDETWNVLAARHLDVIRKTGALSVLPLAISQRISALASAGGLAAAAPLIDELEEVAAATSTQLPPYALLVAAARRGREREVSQLIDTTVEPVIARGEGLALSATHWARAVLLNGLGRYEEAFAAAERGSAHVDDMGFYNWSLAELVEGAVRSGHGDRGRAALSRLCDTTRAAGTDWALGIEARTRALLSDGEVGESLHREAVERLGRTRIHVELARAHLLYGEWLRREHRRLDARGQLRTAHEMFTAMGVEAFGQRAERELVATGDRVRKRSVETREELTAQEAQIARLARDGLSNPDIGARLFISPKTVEYHLHKVFNKLGISSRNQLARTVPSETRAASAR